MANYFEHNLNPQNSASEERKKYLRHIDPERLAKVYKEGEHRRHKGTQKGELFEEQAPERVENAILGPDWCDHLSPEEHSAESIYLIHGVSAETKEFDETGKTIDLRRLHYYMQSGLPQEKEMCGSLIAKDLGGGNRLAFRSAGFIVTPQLITRVFYQDIGSERSDVEDVPPKTSGVRKVKGELDSFYNAEESVPAHGSEYYGADRREFLEIAKQKIQQKENLVRYNLEDALLNLPLFSDIEYSPEQVNFLREELIKYLHDNNITPSLEGITSALDIFYSDKRIKKLAGRARLPLGLAKDYVKMLYERYKNPLEFKNVPYYVQDAFVDPTAGHYAYNEIFFVNPDINGIFIRSMKDLEREKISLESIKQQFPNLPILILDSWTLVEPARDSYF